MKKSTSSKTVKQRVDCGELCRECLDDIPYGPLGHKTVCTSCRRQMAWEEQRDEQYEAEAEQNEE